MPIIADWSELIGIGINARILIGIGHWLRESCDLFRDRCTESKILDPQFVDYALMANTYVRTSTGFAIFSTPTPDIKIWLSYIFLHIKQCFFSLKSVTCKVLHGRNVCRQCYSIDESPQFPYTCFIYLGATKSLELVKIGHLNCLPIIIMLY